ncbi:cAMP-dependent protein kinase catalytic subunit-like, partial [Archocentrus centrarchus]
QQQLQTQQPQQLRLQQQRLRLQQTQQPQQPRLQQQLQT